MLLTAGLCAAVVALGLVVAVIASYAIHEHAESRRLARENLALRAVIRDQNELARLQNRELNGALEMLRKGLRRSA